MRQTSLEEHLALYLLRAAKFEFYLIEKDAACAKTNNENKITGVNWSEIAKNLESKSPFSETNISSFAILKNEPPYYLSRNGNQLEWEKSNASIESWTSLLINGLA